MLRSSKTSSPSHSSRGASEYASRSVPRTCQSTGHRGSLRLPCDFGRGREAEARARDAGAWGGHRPQRGRAGDTVPTAGSTSAGGGQGGARPGHTHTQATDGESLTHCSCTSASYGEEVRGAWGVNCGTDGAARRHDIWPSAPPVSTPECAEKRHLPPPLPCLSATPALPREPGSSFQV